MGKKMSIEAFIEKANKTHHPIIYNYDRVIIKKTDEKIEIGCDKHGYFWQIRQAHLRGHGCQQCAKEIIAAKLKLAPIEILIRARKIHGNKYCYSQFVIANVNSKGEIICYYHGSFFQTFQNHESGDGCPECSKNKKLNINEFILRANKKHYFKYKYDKSVYYNIGTKIIVTCLDHGDFLTLPEAHLRGAGCMKCWKIKQYEMIQDKIKINKNEWLKRFEFTHHNKYDYSLFESIPGQKSIFICKDHGKFEQDPGVHANGQGCPQCGSEKSRRGRLKLFKYKNNIIDICNKLHYNKYNYELIEVISLKNKQKIICQDHGIFLQSLDYHLKGYGCPICTGFIGNKSKIEIAWLDHINIPDNYRQKTIHINNTWLKVDAFVPETNTVYEFNGDFWHGNPNLFHPTEMNPIVKKTYGELHQKTINRERALVAAGFNVISIWEHEFKKILLEKLNES